MSELRDTIISTIENAAQGTDLARSTWYDTRTRQETPVIEDTADRILAAFADALTSDAAVDTMARDLYDRQDDGIFEWDSLPDEGGDYDVSVDWVYGKNDYRREARANIATALVAVGVVKGEGDG